MDVDKKLVFKKPLRKLAHIQYVCMYVSYEGHSSFMQNVNFCIIQHTKKAAFVQ